MSKPKKRNPCALLNGPKIRGLMEKRGLSVAKVEAHLFLYGANVNLRDYLNRGICPSSPTLWAIGKILKVDMGKLMMPNPEFEVDTL